MAICCYRRSVSPTAELQSVRAYTISPVTTAPRSDKHDIYDSFGEGPRRKEEEQEEVKNRWGNDGGGGGGSITHGNRIIIDGIQLQVKEDQPPEVKEFVTDLHQNGVIQPLLTDLYQITMAYAYWKTGKKDETSVFDLFFRRNPFKGEFCLFAGLEECLKFLKNFHFSPQDIEYLRTVLPDTAEEDFFEYLQNLTTDEVTVMAIDEGSVVFPKVPLLRLEGPLAVIQLLETTLLTLVNFASLVATNAARFRMAAGPDKSLLEFGLRRAQGPDGGLSASRYCYLGGFDGTSNVLAGKMYGIPVKGTHAHAYVTSYTGLHDLKKRLLRSEWGMQIDLVKLSTDWLEKVGHVLDIGSNDTNQGELAAFIAYALAFPAAFLALVDTYDVLRSGIPNFCAVAMALGDMGYRSQGVRIDSGDLAYLSLETRDCFKKIARAFKRNWFEDMMIVGSNDINEKTIHSLNEKANAGNRSKGHSIDCFGIGTHLVTCQAQPALGCVFKLVEVNGIPRIKLSEDVGKVTIPGKKVAYRLYSSDGTALSDLLLQPDEDPPQPGKRILCRHPFQESKRVNIVPARVEPLYKVYYKHGQIQQDLPVLKDLRQKAIESLKCIRLDQKRNLNPTPYKVSVTDKLYNFIHDLWLSNAPIGELA